MLVKQLSDPARLATLSQTWRRDGAVRVAPAFVERELVAWAAALRAREHTPIFDLDATRGYQLWRFTWEPGRDCDHPLCALGRWLRGDGVTWASALTGLALRADDDATMRSDRHAKGSFYDAHDDGGHAAVGYLIHLTPAPWPEAWGGHVQVVDANGRVRSTWAPTWNAIDLFDVRAAGAWQRMPIVREHLDGFTVSGHWYAADR